MTKSPGEEGLAQRGPSLDLLDILLVPKDARGIVLACGFAASAAFGLGTLLGVGDPIGWAYLLLAAIGYFFLQTRGLPTFLWLLVAAGGAAVVMAGNLSGWIEVGLGLALAVVALLPVAPELREQGVNSPAPPTATFEGLSPQLPPSIQVGAAPAASSPADWPSATLARRVGLRACGVLQITIGDNDLSSRLEPRLKFLLAYLITRRVLGQVATERLALAEEIAPRINPGHQRERLRKQLSELQLVDPAFRELVKADRDKVWLRLDEVDCDAIQLIDVAKRTTAENDLIDRAATDQLQQLLDQTASEFLAGFDGLEQHVTSGRGGASELVRAARLAIAGARADLTRALAEHHLAAGHAESAISRLVEALEECPDRQDLARLLVAAYLQTGQMSRAREARREYDLIEGEMR